jgi:hypothetical protein
MENKKKINDSMRIQVQILEKMASITSTFTSPITKTNNPVSEFVAFAQQPYGSPVDVEHIAKHLALNDNKDLQRYLFILEGQKLVTPVPPGDLTSRFWAITEQGAIALRRARVLLDAA